MYSNILVPIALDHDTATQESFAIACRMLADGGTITALHVMEELPPYVAQQLPPGQREQQQADFKSALSAAVTDIPGAKAALVIGHAGRSILEFAKSDNGGCIVIASHRPVFSDILFNVWKSCLLSTSS